MPRRSEGKKNTRHLGTWVGGDRDAWINGPYLIVPTDALILPDLSLHVPPGGASFLPDCGQLRGEGESLCGTGSEPLPELLFPWTCRGCGQELEKSQGQQGECQVGREGLVAM